MVTAKMVWLISLLLICIVVVSPLILIYLIIDRFLDFIATFRPNQKKKVDKPLPYAEIAAMLFKTKNKS